MTLEEAIKILRRHNQTGTSVMRLTGGKCLEHDLLERVAHNSGDYSDSILRVLNRMLSLTAPSLIRKE